MLLGLESPRIGAVPGDKQYDLDDYSLFIDSIDPEITIYVKGYRKKVNFIVNRSKDRNEFMKFIKQVNRYPLVRS